MPQRPESQPLRAVQLQRRQWLATAAGAALAVVPFALLLAWVIGTRLASERPTRDSYYHVNAIVQFARQWPRPNVSDYFSATTPGFHLVMAGVYRFATTDLLTLRCVASVFTLGLLATLGGLLVDSWRDLPRAVWAWPAAGSLYVVSSGAWLLPDNAAWWALLAVLGIALFRQVGPAAMLVVSPLLVLLVAFRQTQLWVALPLVCTAWLDAKPIRGLTDVTRWPVRRARRAGWMLLATLPAVAVLAYFVAIWHGLTPPAFQRVEGPTPLWHSGLQHDGLNFAAPALLLSVLGIYGLFFAWPALGHLPPRRTLARWLAAGAAVGLVAAVISPTSYDFPARASGLWNLTPHFPAPAGRSLLILCTSLLGGMMTGLFCAALTLRDRIVLIATLAGFTLAAIATAIAYQRYFDPFVLLLLPLLCLQIVRQPVADDATLQTATRHANAHEHAHEHEHEHEHAHAHERPSSAKTPAATHSSPHAPALGWLGPLLLAIASAVLTVHNLYATRLF